MRTKKDKRKSAIRGQAVSRKSLAEIEHQEPANSDISMEERRFLKKTLRGHFLFSGLGSADHDLIIDSMQRLQYEKGDVVFTQGAEQEVGGCYFIQSGLFSVSIDGKYLKDLQRGQSFGELALLYSCKRTATVSCVAPGSVWMMSGRSFRRSMRLVHSKKIDASLQFIESTPPFSRLSATDQRHLASICIAQDFQKKEVLVRVGEMSQWMFIIMSGKVMLTDKLHNRVNTLKTGDLVGSFAFLNGTRHRVTATALEHVQCLSIGRATFQRLLANVTQVLSRLNGKTLLEQCSFFRQLTPEQQDVCVDQLEECHVNTGDVIVSPGSTSQLLLVLAGEVEAITCPKEHQRLASFEMSEGMTAAYTRGLSRLSADDPTPTSPPINPLQSLHVPAAPESPHHVDSETASPSRVRPILKDSPSPSSVGGPPRPILKKGTADFDSPATMDRHRSESVVGTNTMMEALDDDKAAHRRRQYSCIEFNGDGIPGEIGKAGGAGERYLTEGRVYGVEYFDGMQRMPHWVVARTPCRISRLAYKQIVEKLAVRSGAVMSLADTIRANEIWTVLRQIWLFKTLKEQQVQSIVASLSQRTYGNGDIVVEQGEEANLFYLIQSGTIRVERDGQVLRTLGKWDYFGERALLLSEKRSARCIAGGHTTCLTLESAVFKEVVGAFRNTLEHRMRLQDLNIELDDLEVLKQAGKGAVGVVKLVRHRVSGQQYALKCIDKEAVARRKQQRAVLTERQMLLQCYHPCLVQFIKSFKDDSHVYFLQEYLGGGDLFYAIRQIGILTKPQAQFYIGAITLGIDYLHQLGIIYRNLKPENLLLDEQGYCKLVDFGCCKQQHRAYTLVGTPEYIAPEVILNRGYTSAVDWWSVGVCLCEFVVGPLPFGQENKTGDQMELYKDILEGPLHIPPYVDKDAAALITGLLERNPQERLGSSSHGGEEVKEHPFFKHFDWDALLCRTVTPPWVPPPPDERPPLDGDGEGHADLKTSSGEPAAPAATKAISSQEHDDGADGSPEAALLNWDRDF